MLPVRAVAAISVLSLLSIGCLVSRFLGLGLGLHRSVRKRGFAAHG